MDKYRDLVSGGGLSLDRLRNFCLIDEAGGLSKAAGGDPGRMSLLSRQVRELEEFFGVKLTRKAGRTLQITDEGRRLAAIARGHLVALQDFTASVRDEAIELTLGAGNSVIEWLLMPRVQGLCDAFPSVRFAFRTLRSQDVVEGLQGMTIDVGIVRQDAVPGGLETTGRIPVCYALFLPEGLADEVTRESLPEGLGSLPIATSIGGQFREQLELAASRTGLDLRITLGCSSFTQAARVVEKGAMAAILPDLAQAYLESSKVRMLPLGFLDPYRRILGVTWNPRAVETRPAVRGVLNHLAKYLAGANVFT